MGRSLWVEDEIIRNVGSVASSDIVKEMARWMHVSIARSLGINNMSAQKQERKDQLQTHLLHSMAQTMEVIK